MSAGTEGEVVERRLPVDLTREERHERAMELSEKIAESRALEARRKAAAADFKAQDQEIRARADELSEAVKSGRESRPVECRWVRNDTYQRMELHRLDTGEVIESRALTPAEKQVLMFKGPQAIAETPTKKRKAGGEGTGSGGEN